MVGYHVYWSLVSGQLYESRTTAPVAAPAYSETEAIDGLTYYFVVTAVTATGLESAFSAELEIEVNTPPAAPLGFGAEPGNREIQLDWQANTEDDLAGYRVYRSEVSGGPYSEVSGVLLNGTEFTDTDVSLETTYYYVVRAEDLGGGESGDSVEADAIPERAWVLVVNDEGDDAYADGVADAIHSSGLFVDQWDIRDLGSPPLVTLADYPSVIWNLGPEFSSTVTGAEQAILIQYLDGGGALALFGQDLLHEVAVTEPFVADYLHVAGVVEDSCQPPANGTTADPISNGMVLPLNPPFTNQCDTLVPDAEAVTVFTDQLGDAVAFRADLPEGGRSFFAAFAFEGVSEFDPAPNNRAILVDRLLSWFNSGPTPLFADGFETGDFSGWDSATGGVK